MIDPKRPMGPNFEKLVFAKMAKEAIPDGQGLAAGIKFLSNPQSISTGFRSSVEWCDSAIRAVRSASDPNPWKNSTEEEIAGELVRRIEDTKVLAKK